MYAFEKKPLGIIRLFQHNGINIFQQTTECVEIILLFLFIRIENIRMFWSVLSVGAV